MRAMQALPGVATGDDGTRRWDAAEPYLLRHLAEHAAEAGRADEFVTDPGFLVYADPISLGPIADKVTTERGRLCAAVYRESSARHRTVGPAVRRDLLGFDAARYGAAD